MGRKRVDGDEQDLGRDARRGHHECRRPCRSHFHGVLQELKICTKRRSLKKNGSPERLCGSRMQGMQSWGGWARRCLKCECAQAAPLMRFRYEAIVRPLMVA